jgi:hypothetical protein
MTGIESLTTSRKSCGSISSPPSGTWEQGTTFYALCTESDHPGIRDILGCVDRPEAQIADGVSSIRFAVSLLMYRSPKTSDQFSHRYRMVRTLGQIPIFAPAQELQVCEVKNVMSVSEVSLRRFHLRQCIDWRQFDRPP